MLFTSLVLIQLSVTIGVGFYFKKTKEDIREINKAIAELQKKTLRLR